MVSLKSVELIRPHSLARDIVQASSESLNGPDYDNLVKAECAKLDRLAEASCDCVDDLNAKMLYLTLAKSAGGRDDYKEAVVHAVEAWL